MLADRIDETLASFEVAPETTSSDGVSALEMPKAFERGTLDRMGDLENNIPEVVKDMTQLSKLMEDLGESVSIAGPEFAKAKTFNARLALSKALAAKLDPIADGMVMTAENLVSHFGEWDFMVQYILKYAANGSDLNDPDVKQAIGGLWQLASTGAASLAVVDDLVQMIAQGIGISRELDRPFKAIQAACLKIADLGGILDGWKQGLRTLEAEYLVEGYLDNLPDFLNVTGD